MQVKYKNTLCVYVLGPCAINLQIKKVIPPFRPNNHIASKQLLCMYN